MAKQRLMRGVFLEMHTVIDTHIAQERYASGITAGWQGTRPGMQVFRHRSSCVPTHSCDPNPFLPAVCYSLSGLGPCLGNTHSLWQPLQLLSLVCDIKSLRCNKPKDCATCTHGCNTRVYGCHVQRPHCRIAQLLPTLSLSQ